MSPDAVLERAQGVAARLRQDAVARDADHAFPTENLLEMGRQGLMGINVPAAYGGLEAGVVAYATAVRELAAACGGTTVGMMVTNMVAETICRFGTDALAQEVVPGILDASAPAAAFCLSEPGSGSDAAGMRATAVRDGDDYVLNGTKAWITSGGHAGVYLIMAVTDPAARSRGISAFVVDAGTPGLSAAKPEEKLGQHASATTQIILDNCRVPAGRLLGEEGIGFKVAMTALDGGRIGVSAQALGIALGAQRAARESGVADPRSEAELEAGWMLCLRAAQLKDAGKRVTREAAMAKVYCTEAATRVCQRALKALAGTPQAVVAARALRDSRVTRIYEGTSEVQRIVIAREVLRA